VIRSRLLCSLLIVVLGVTSFAVSADDAPSGVLFIVPQENFADGDFFPVVTALRGRDIPVYVAAPSAGRAETTAGEFVDVDFAFYEVDSTAFEAIVVSGGFGAFALLNDPLVFDILSVAAEAGRVIAGVCAGNDLLVQLGFAEGRAVANTPERAGFPARYGAISSGEVVWVSVTADGSYTLITSLGYAHAVAEFAETLAEMLAD